MSRALRRLLPPAALLGLLAGCASGPAPDRAAPTSSPAASALPAPAAPAGARDAFVLLSGGGTPLSNNYSQYLQARAFATYFEKRYADRPHWVFFGVGNRAGEPPLLADARQQVIRDGRLLESWRPGPLRHNRPATRESFLAALRDEILPTVRGGGTLFLVVGDHGAESDGDGAESLITMWQLKRSTGRGAGWTTDDDQTLGVAELRRVLAEGIGRGRLVFVMTQCHSGGFHQLGAPREVTPPAHWFLTRPGRPAAPPAPLPLRAAGFTATDQQSPAAGCEADPDPDTWAGYERFIPEALLGLDLFTLQPTGPGLPSFAAAHEAATLVDRTIDKPRSTSEHYLETWARAIERLPRQTRLTPRATAAVAAYHRAVDLGRVVTDHPGVRERQALFQRFTQRIAEQAPPATALTLAGDRSRLENAIRPAGRRPGAASAPRSPRGSRDDARKAWVEVVRPAWKAAVLAGQVPGLDGAALAFEKQLLRLEDRGRNFMFARGAGDALLNEMYWRSGYAQPATLDPAKAAAVTRWGAERRERIATWARASSDAAVRRGIAAMNPAGARRPPAPPPGAAAPEPLSPRTAAERVLFYRRTLAAWEFLVTMDHREALAEVQALTELERTPLP